MSERDRLEAQNAIAFELAQIPWSLSGQERQQLQSLIVALLTALSEGSTLLQITGAARASSDYLSPSLRAAAKTMLQKIGNDSLIGPPEKRRPLVFADGALSLARFYWAEANIGTQVSVRKQPSDLPDEIESLVEKLCSHPELQVSGEQKQAVRKSLRHNFSLITGGPGTGKTTVITLLLATAVKANISADAITIATPTARAAQRVEQSLASQVAKLPEELRPLLSDIAKRASTVHRLLGIGQDREGVRQVRRALFGTMLLVVDEASMLDLTTFEALLSALPPSAQIVLVGDAAQLPSVEAGLVFRELVAAPALVHVTSELTQCFRINASEPKGSQILICAQKVREGKTFFSEIKKTTRAEDIEFVGFEWLSPEDATTLQKFLSRWHHRLGWADLADTLAQLRLTASPDGIVDDAHQAILSRFFTALQRRRLLTAGRKMALGVDAMNIFFHDKHASTTWQSPQERWLWGEPIIVRQNNYDLRLWNGEIGIVLPFLGEHGDLQKRAVFERDGSYWSTPTSAIDAISEHAYAITTHQSQGSEFDEACVILPDAANPLLTRELLYTALTRAKRSLVVVADKKTLDTAIKRKTERLSRLSTLLQDKPH